MIRGPNPPPIIGVIEGCPRIRDRARQVIAGCQASRRLSIKSSREDLRRDVDRDMNDMRAESASDYRGGRGLSISAPTMPRGSSTHGSSAQKGPIILHEGSGMSRGSFFCSPRGSSIVNVPEGREDRWTFTKSSLFVRVRTLIIALHIQL